MTEKSPLLTFTLDKAGTVLAAMRLESDAKAPLDAAAKNRATHMAGELLGSQARFEDLVYERAKIILKAAGAEASETRPPRLVPPALLTWALLFAAFAAGFASQAVTGEGSRINLLGGAFLALIAWNLLVYAALAAKALVSSDNQGLRSLFVYACQKPLLRGLADRGAILADNMRLLQAYAARAFHLAAIAFAAGAVASLFLSGIGTQFTVGWESTWFAASPETVHAILSKLYAATNWVAGAFPNVRGVLDMRFDRQVLHGQALSAAPWLIRMALVLVFAIVVPRAILALAAHLSLRAATRRLTVRADTPYFHAIRNTWQSQSVHLDIIVDVHAEEAMLKDVCALAQSVGFNLKDVKTHAWNVQDDPLVLALEKKEGLHEIWVLTSGSLTPESEVLGRALACIRETYAPKWLFLFVDMREILARFAHLPERIESRKELYARFALENGVTLFLHAGQPFDPELVENLGETLAKGFA